ncbi:MAG: hypothetical protein ACXW3N_10835 [Rhodoplanes sp.]
MVGRSTPRDDHEHEPFEEQADPAEPETFEKGGRELDPENRDIGHHAQRGLEHDRIRVEVPGQEQVQRVEIAAEIDQHGDARERVAEHPAEQSRAHDRMVLPLIEHISEERHREAAAADGGADDHVKGDPDSPRITGINVGDRADAEIVALGDVVESDQRQHGENRHRDGKNAAP